MNAQPSPASPPNILVVDDVPENLKLLTAILKSNGYKVRPVSSGSLALESARKMQPDLILLDIMMPEMNGYAVCERLKADAALADIPVIFLSALGECVDKVQALRGGGMDYITKPFQAEEVMARIDVHLELRRLRMELKKQNGLLEEKVRLRTRELAEAHDRLAILDTAKSDFLSLISHELRTPLNGVFGIAELIFDMVPLAPEEKELLRHYQHSRQRVLSVLDDSMLLTQMGLQAAQFAAVPVSLTEALHCAILAVSDPVKMYQSTFGPPPALSVPVFGDAEMLRKALEALLESAAKFSEAGSVVEFSESTSETAVTLDIKATGYRLPPELLSKAFDVLVISEATVPGGDLGLKLPLAERIVALMGGSITIENCDPPGIRLSVQFKRCPDASHEHRTA